jgi:hypothetical protein
LTFDLSGRAFNVKTIEQLHSLKVGKVGLPSLLPEVALLLVQIASADRPANERLAFALSR